MIIQANLLSIYNQNSMKRNDVSIKKNSEKLSTGFRINSAADDASGLAISEKMRSQIRSLNQGMYNISDGIGVTKTADGSLTEVSSMLQRVNELSVAASNGVYSEADRLKVAREVNDIYDEMDRIFETTQFNETVLFRGDNLNYPMEYDIQEKITILEDSTVEWGAMDNIRDKSFDKASKAVGASLVMKFDNSIDMNNPKTLIGKTLNLNGHTYKFTEDVDSSYNISLKDVKSLQEAFDKLSDKTNGYYYSLDKSKTVVNNDRSVTFAFNTKELRGENLTNIDGSDVYWPIANPDEILGEFTNNCFVNSNDVAMLEAIDYGSVILGEVATSPKFTIMGSQNDDTLLSSDIKKNLEFNTLIVGEESILLKEILTASITTVGEFRKAVVDKINSLPQHIATLDSATGEIQVKTTNSSKKLKIYESELLITPGTPGTSNNDGTPYIPAVPEIPAIPASFDKNLAGPKQKITEYEIPFDEIGKPTSDVWRKKFEVDLSAIPDFGVTINGSRHIFYDKSKMPELEEDYGYDYPSAIYHDISGKDFEQKQQSFMF